MTEKFTDEEMLMFDSFEKELLKEYQEMPNERREAIEKAYQTFSLLKARAKERLKEGKSLFEFLKTEITENKIDRISFTKREFSDRNNLGISALDGPLKPHMLALETLLRKKGFVKITKNAWRKLSFTSDEQKRVEEAIKNISNAKKEEAFVLAVAWEFWRISKPECIDWKGFNRFDMVGAHNRWVALIYERPSESKITEIVKWFVTKLLKYEDQLKELGIDFERLEEAP